ncbi:D(1)-like dopamine receptor [Nematostella vectensis]|uniref:D(1)-like dopamine receptor n=1 Tax=Nematostella vectensis TaxID=45351 RepID=UPI0020776659|nr:D(1)-like dopamine receptor [Nematostella vectensis]
MTDVPTSSPCTVHTVSTGSILTAFCYGALIPPTVLGNGLVVISFVINRRLRTATNIFILGLSLSDLLIGSYSLPFWTYIVSYDFLSVGICYKSLYQTYICMDILTGCASILQLTAIATERLFFTISPLKHRRLPRLVYYIMLIAAWLFSTFVAALQPVQSESWEHIYSVFLLVTCFIIPLIIIISVYLYILHVGRRQARPRRSSQSSVGSSGGYLKEFHIFITVIVITGLFVTAWMPFFVVTVIATLCPSCLPPVPQVYHLVRFVKWMQYSSSSVNPYIYAYRNVELKRTFWKVLESCLCGLYKRDRPGSINDFHRRSEVHMPGCPRKMNSTLARSAHVNASFKDEMENSVAPERFQSTPDQFTFERQGCKENGRETSYLDEEIVNLGPAPQRFSLQPKKTTRGSTIMNGHSSLFPGKIDIVKNRQTNPARNHHRSASVSNMSGPPRRGTGASQVGRPRTSTLSDVRESRDNPGMKSGSRDRESRDSEGSRKIRTSSFATDVARLDTDSASRYRDGTRERWRTDNVSTRRDPSDNQASYV